jgi:hypothetical protein
MLYDERPFGGADRPHGTQGERGTLSPNTASGVATFLGQPAVAAALGVVLGIAMLALTAAGVRSFTPETLEIGAMRAISMMVVGLVVAFGALLLFYLFVRPGLVPFGLGLAAGFTVPALIALFRTSGIGTSSTTRR